MNFHPHALWALAGVFGILILATPAAHLIEKRRQLPTAGELTLRVRSWWIMVSLFSAAVLLGATVTTWLLGFISFLALKEYLSLIPTRRSDRRVLFWAYLTIPLQYYWAAIGWYGMFIIFIPVYALLVISARKVLIGETEDFLRSMGTIHWGLMMTVFSISHAAYLLALPEDVAPAGGVGLLIYLVLLTELNDVAQYVWGKRYGRRKVVPRVSPGKTWGGLIGGCATTLAVALASAPFLTPLNPIEAVGAGLIIGLSGFLGDVVISAVKRDIGIKDSGSLLPGHGGILDRVDSLTFTAPLFFHYLYYLYY
ncbi:phosphatidate cytidylyltransferase [Sedimenticola hydrogenitrophicus]|uniref:phosphatidate cytidylyltransferase n=1 Tax=Sedimenticola hydrogenitrophicus TaxID=2967975 RepID=UPI0023B19E7C|nr:phosphatidate cytidylyltransferase [Sedimenticola hydrogenitrophicus]